ncbi:MAG: rhamnan synthesis F family protein [Fibromonadaceae bacterium]|jgi:rhamnosyltransferase|nr:rhamnan synthesis F family protein [Fibromonadaceae bacterium]
MHDPDGIADDYIFYLLHKIKCYANHLVIVCNGAMQNEYVVKLKKLSDELFIRKGGDFDCGAFKDVFTKLLGWEKVDLYDELLLLNDSCFGPIFPLEDIFDEMEGKSDFWGITAQNKIDKSKKTYDYEQNILPYHLQPYFLIVEKRMLLSTDFKEFWNTLGETDTYSKATTQYELRLTDFFESRGYKSAVYIDNKDFFSSHESNYIYIIFDTYRLLTEHALPFIKRKSLLMEPKDTYEFNVGEIAKKSIDYIAMNTDYDINIIWKNLIRISHPVDLKNSLHLNFVLSSKHSLNNLPQNRKIVLIAHLNYTDLIDYAFTYICKVPKDIDIIISTKGEINIAKITKKFESLERTNYRIVVPEDRGREVSSFLIVCKELLMQYDYVGFIKDKKSCEIVKHQTVGRSWMEITLENTIKSDNFIYNIIDCFEQNPKLGFLSPPTTYASQYFTAIAFSWGSNFDETMKLAERLKLRCKISIDKQPFALGGVFWFRPKALKALFDYNWKYEDFHKEPVPIDGTVSHAIERIYSYVAQHEGYYSGLLFNEEYASLYLTNYQYMLAKFVSDYHFLTGLSKFDVVATAIGVVERFANKYDKVYIYGTGMHGHNCYYLLEDRVSNVAGFIVSDGYRKNSKIKDKPVYELSELSPEPTTGIIVALNVLLQKKVLPELNKRGFNEIYTILGGN